MAIKKRLKFLSKKDLTMLLKSSYYELETLLSAKMRFFSKHGTYKKRKPFFNIQKCLGFFFLNARHFFLSYFSDQVIF
jgi:hypothetical protein